MPPKEACKCWETPESPPWASWAPVCSHPCTHLVGSLSHELLGGLFPDGRYRDDPSDIRVLELRTGLVAQLLKPKKVYSRSSGQSSSSCGFAENPGFLAVNLLNFHSLLNLPALGSNGLFSEYSASRELLAAFTHCLTASERQAGQRPVATS